MTVTYGPHTQRIWHDAVVLPGFDNLLDSLTFEVAHFLGQSIADTAQLLRTAWATRAEEMVRLLPPAATKESLEAYYDEQANGILTSAYWHSLVPDRYALHSVSGLHALQHFAEGIDVFEFGHGIGSTAILLSRHGFVVTGGDISSSYQRFAQQRLSRRELDIPLLDLKRERPKEGSFDAIVSFDVLEHIPDPLSHVARMRTWLKPGGLLVLNIAFGRDENNPEHMQPYRLGVLDRIRSLGFERVPWPTLYVFAKRPLGRVKRLAYRTQDVFVAAVEDVVSRAPRLGKLVRGSSLPPMS